MLAGLRDRPAEALHYVTLHLMDAIFVDTAERLHRLIHIKVCVHFHLVAETALTLFIAEPRSQLLLQAKRSTDWLLGSVRQQITATRISNEPNGARFRATHVGQELVARIWLMVNRRVDVKGRARGHLPARLSAQLLQLSAASNMG